MKNKNLSWKVLLGLGVLFYVVSKTVGVVVGDTFMILVAILIALGIFELLRSWAVGKDISKK